MPLFMLSGIFIANISVVNISATARLVSYSGVAVKPIIGTCLLNFVNLSEIISPNI